MTQNCNTQDAKSVSLLIRKTDGTDKDKSLDIKY